MRPALELRDLLDQVRELVRVELSLFRAEIGERTRRDAAQLPRTLQQARVNRGCLTQDLDRSKHLAAQSKLAEISGIQRAYQIRPKADGNSGIT